MFEKYYHVDTLFNLGFFSYLFIRWGISVWIYGDLLYSLSLSLLLGFILLTFLIDWVFFCKKKLFIIQIIFTLLLLFLFVFVFFTFLIILPGLISIGFILFLILMISKTIRFISISITYKDCKQNRLNTRLTSNHIKNRRLPVLIFISLFLFPFIVFMFGLSPFSLSSIEININNQKGPHKGSNEIQLSFYATLSSYDYLTNETVLSALNGTDFGDGKLDPTEILLLIHETEINNATHAQKLAYMVHNCTKSGLKVWIWFVYDIDNGYYPSYEDYEYLPEFKKLFDEWVSNFSLNIHGLLFDNEMDQFAASISMDNIFSYLQTILQYRRKVKKDWQNAVEMYKNCAEEWSDQGYKIALVGMEMTLYDIIDGDPDIQQMSGIVNKPPDMWERVSFMLYRSCEYHTTPYAQDYLYTLSKLHKRLYGARAVVAIGCMSYDAYDTIDEILSDIAIMKFNGYSTTELFEFGAFYRTFGQEGLISILNSSLSGWKYPRFRIHFRTIEFLLKYLLLFADIFLDFY